MTWFKVDFSVPTKIHLFDHTIMPILIHGSLVWGYNSFEQNDVFQLNYLRGLLKLHKSVHTPIIYRELSCREIVFTALKRTFTFWKTVIKPSQKFCSVLLDKTKNMNKLKRPGKINLS